MANVTPKPFRFGIIAGSIYDFPKAGDVLPLHGHDESTQHITIVAKGAIRVVTPVFDQILEAGAMIDFPALQTHEFTATQDDSRIINIQKQ